MKLNSPNKLLGQHFLRCGWVSKTLIKTAELSKKDIVLEAGAGEGVLTFELAKNAGRVIAVEKDNALADFLTERIKKEKIKNIQIIQGDILKLLPLLSKTYDLTSKTYKIVSNIPYYLTSRLFRILLSQGFLPEKIVLTVQKEVAQRITARPPRMNLLALSVQAFGKPRIIKAVPKECFYPKPGVDSAIIAVSDISDMTFSDDMEKDKFFKLIRMGFSKKRKYLLSNLKDMNTDRKEILEGLNQCKIGANSRAENLSIDQWICLAGKF